MSFTCCNSSLSVFHERKFNATSQALEYFNVQKSVEDSFEILRSEHKAHCIKLLLNYNVCDWLQGPHNQTKSFHNPSDHSAYLKLKTTNFLFTFNWQLKADHKYCSLKALWCNGLCVPIFEFQSCLQQTFLH